jgi:hypothetical protein
MISHVLLPALVAMLLTPATGSPSVGTSIKEDPITTVFECEVGPRHAATTNCFRISGRYVACYHLSEQKSLEQVSVVPEDWLGEEQFDRERSLSPGEFLQILSQISKIRPVGRLVSPDRALARAVLNNVYGDDEEWENALVKKYVNDWDDSVLSFTVIYYRSISGKVEWYQPPDCTPDAVLGAPLDCRDPSVGPIYLSVNGHDYFFGSDGAEDVQTRHRSDSPGGRSGSGASEA